MGGRLFVDYDLMHARVSTGARWIAASTSRATGRYNLGKVYATPSGLSTLQ